MSTEPKRVAPATAKKPSRYLKAALRYARRGWPVLPLWQRKGDLCTCEKGEQCRSQGKHPIGRLAPHGFKDASTDESTILDWWQRYPAAGIGIATGKPLVVIDVDRKKGRDGTMAMAQLFEELGPLPD